MGAARDFKFRVPIDRHRNFKFGVRIDLQAHKPRNAKLGQKGSGLRHVTYFYNFGTPLYISGTGTVRDFEFGVRIDCQTYKPKNAKVGNRGASCIT